MQSIFPQTTGARCYRGAGVVFAALFPLIASPAVADDFTDSLNSRLAAAPNVAQGLNEILKDAKSPEDRERIAEWLRGKVEAGEGPYSFPLALASLAIANHNPGDALMYFNYVRATIVVDSSTCPDQSSGGSRFEATIFLLGGLIYKLTSDMTPEQKAETIDRALELENRTFQKRKVDPWLCGGGLNAYARDFGARLNSGPNSVVRTDKAPPQAGSYYASDQVWLENRQKALPHLKEFLLPLLSPDTSH
jgi:hypothetical protein